MESVIIPYSSIYSINLNFLQWEVNGVGDKGDNFYPNTLKEGELYNFDFEIMNGEDICSLERDGKYFARCQITKSNETKSYNEMQIEHYMNEIERVSQEDNPTKIYHYDEEIPSKDYPYVIYIKGCDDISYTLCLSSMNHVEAFMETITENPVDVLQLVEQLGFIFTN